MNREKKIVKNGKKHYTEIELDGIGTDRNCRNPLTGVFQYEFALYQTVCDLFASVKCTSMCIDSLMLYFKELPHGSEKNAGEEEKENPGEKKKKTQKGLLAEMSGMVARDVVGNITFPMMHVCQAEARVSTGPDGSHTFIFGDGIYGFSVHLDMPGKGHPKKIKVKNLGTVLLADENRKKVLLNNAA